MTSSWYCGLPGPEFIGHGQCADRLGHPGGAKPALLSQEVEGEAAGVARASPAACRRHLARHDGWICGPIQVAGELLQ
jgi:hypothetical protein